MAKTARHFRRKKLNDDKLRTLWPLRISDADMAQRLGCHRNTVRRRAAKLGLPLRREIWAEEARR